MRHALIVLGLTAGLGFAGAALAVGEDAVKCQQGALKVDATYDKLFWKGYGKGCKEQGVDADADAKAQEKMDKVIEKFQDFVTDPDTSCDPNADYTGYTPASYDLGSISDDADEYCDGVVT